MPEIGQVTQAKYTYPSPKVIGIVGSRRRDGSVDWVDLITVFDAVYQKGDSIVSGGCPKGGDQFAERLARQRGISITIHYPRLEDLEGGIDTKLAYTKINYSRNVRIAQDCDVLIALVAPDRTGGTEHTIREAKKLGKQVILV